MWHRNELREFECAEKTTLRASGTDGYLCAGALRFNSLYDETSLMLDILGYIMAVGTTFFVVLTYIHRRRSEEPNLGAACVFYAAVVLAILFFGSWIDSLNDYVHLSEQTTNNVWTVVDVMFVVVGYTVSARLWQQDRTK